MRYNQDEELKYVSFDVMFNFFQDFGSYEDIEDETLNTVFEIVETPKRSDVAYKTFEEMDNYNLTSYIIFLMAIRNKKVKEIVLKVKYIFDYIANDNVLVNNKHMKENNVEINYIEEKLEYDYFSFMILDMEFEEKTSEKQRELKQKYISTGLKPFDEFKKDLESLTNENETNNLYFENLCAIIKNLFNILRNNFLIYPCGYKSDSNCDDIYELIEKKELVPYGYSDLICGYLEDFKKLYKDKILLADLFFIYDYHSYKINQDDIADKTYITKNIKCALTKYHGISKKGCSSIITYEDFSKNYSNYKNEEANFGYYITERSLRSKISMMQKFIDECGYKSLFYI
ncbi:hypothetical protein N3114_10185 [Aliarcobacter butzleri]|uniref:hypothetical protein n=1 Tax=Aliarcobacter butzleri TaxID=28197 RepID=UPI0021B2C178|nr:hypothetical protein [Aliarcobacter butzleri]UXC29010.1 hypothetical protein N3114_10185 [Aliarcobacter butzleri]